MLYQSKTTHDLLKSYLNDHRQYAYKLALYHDQSHDEIHSMMHQSIDSSIDSLKAIHAQLSDAELGFKSDFMMALIQNAIDNHHHLKNKLTLRQNKTNIHKQHLRRLAMGTMAAFGLMSGVKAAGLYDVGQVPSRGQHTTAVSAHRGDPALAAHFQTSTLPKNEALKRAHPKLAAFEKVKGVQTSRIAPQLKQPRLDVINTDTVSAAKALGLDSATVILNLANKTVPGGRVLQGSRAQEEDLCRNTSLYESLMSAKGKGLYPLGVTEALYSPYVYIHSNRTKTPIACITMAGYRTTDGRVDKADYPGEAHFVEGMKQKWRVILSIAIANGKTKIVLGALGCGAFANDATGKPIKHIPVDVARALAEVLNEPYISGTYKQYFDRITVAIKEEGDEHLGNTFKNALLGHMSSATAQPAGRPTTAGAGVEITDDFLLTQLQTQFLSILKPAAEFEPNFTSRSIAPNTKMVIKACQINSRLGDVLLVGELITDGKKQLFEFSLDLHNLSDSFLTQLSSLPAPVASSAAAADEVDSDVAPQRRNNPAPAAAGYSAPAPQLDVATLKTTVADALLSATNGNFRFSGDRYTPNIIGAATRWTGTRTPWAANITSFRENSDGGFTLMVAIAHQDRMGAWYTTDIEIIGSTTALTPAAKEWLNSKFSPAPAPVATPAPQTRPAAPAAAVRSVTPAAMPTYEIHIADDSRKLSAAILNGRPFLTSNDFKETLVPNSTVRIVSPKPAKELEIKSAMLSRDGGFTLVASFTHSANGRWYTTDVKINGKQSALSSDAVTWIRSF